MKLRRREFTALVLGGAAAFSLAGQAAAESDPLPSWNEQVVGGAGSSAFDMARRAQSSSA
jgi:hypothetical protein